MRKVLIGTFIAVHLAALAPARVAGAQDRAPVPRDTVHLQTRGVPPDAALQAARVFNAPETMRATGALEVPQGTELTSDVAVIEGPLTIAGRITGSVVAINADVVLVPGARVEGGLLVVGGELRGREGATIGGEVQVYRARLQFRRDGDRIEVVEGDANEWWWQRYKRERLGAWSDISLVSARTYNRVEGLPVYLGPRFGFNPAWGSVRVDAYGIVRTAEGFNRTSDNIGHTLRTEVRVGDRHGLTLGARLFDVVEPVEEWHLSDAEVGLATFLLHRDLRDYYNRSGGSIYGGYRFSPQVSVTLTFSDERWGSRQTEDPWALIRNEGAWRANPRMDDGSLHLFGTRLTFDTRTDRDDPRSGWLVVSDYEHGTGTIVANGLHADPDVLAAPRRVRYHRGTIDMRRYNRVAPGAQLNLRLLLGGWLGGDPLPLQRRFSVSGPGGLSGFDFRRSTGNTDYWQCSQPRTIPAPGGGNAIPFRFPGSPAECDRMALVQAEYRGDIRIDPFGIFDDDGDRRRRWGRGAEWVVFADAGRGWLVGDRLGTLRYPSSRLPSLGTVQTDVGVGVIFDEIGVYLAKATSDLSAPPNLIVRLRRRF